MIVQFEGEFPPEKIRPFLEFVDPKRGLPNHEPAPFFSFLLSF